MTFLRSMRFLTLLASVFCLAASESAEEPHPDIFVDQTGWVNPNNPLEALRTAYGVTGECAAVEEVEKCRQELVKLQSDYELLKAAPAPTPHQNFAKELLANLLYDIGVDINAHDLIFKRADVTLTHKGMETLRRFFAEPFPSEGLKASVLVDMKNFFVESSDVRESVVESVIRRGVPFAVAAVIVQFIYFLFHFRVVRSPAMLFSIIFAIIFFYQVSKICNMRYQEAVIRRIARDSQRSKDDACAKKGYFAVGVQAVQGFFFRMPEDECYGYYRDVMTDADVDVNVLNEAFHSLGESIGSFLHGLAGMVGKAVEAYFGSGPLFVMMTKAVVLVPIVAVVTILLLQYMSIEIEIPLLLKIRTQVGRSLGGVSAPPLLPSAPSASAPALLPATNEAAIAHHQQPALSGETPPAIRDTAPPATRYVDDATIDDVMQDRIVPQTDDTSARLRQRQPLLVRASHTCRRSASCSGRVSLPVPV